MNSLRYGLKYLFVLSILSITITQNQCWSANQPTTNQPTTHPPDVDNTVNTSPAIPNTDAASKPALQGSVEKIELNLSLLQDIGLDLKHALKACSNLYDEVTIRPVRIITEPEVVGRGIIINIPIATQPTGPSQPARKDRVDLAMSEVMPIITLLKNNVDAYVAGSRQLEMSDEVRGKLQSQLKDWVTVVNNLFEMGKRLTQLTQGPKYDNNTIAKQVAYMEQDIQKLDVLRNSIYKVVRKEAKRTSN